MNVHPITTPASPSLASPHFDGSLDSIESISSSVTSPVLPTLETTTVTEVALGYHRNQQYSITAMTTSSGAVAERYAYTAYGQPTILNASGSVLTSSAVGNRYTYTGREWDETLGLHHFRARWMSPLAGSFLGRDPIVFKGSRQGQYSYFEHKPHVRIDPSGLILARGELFVGKIAYTFPSDPFANSAITASAWLNGVSNDGCRFDSPPVGDKTKPTQIGWSRVGGNFQSEESRSGPSTFLVSSKSECCCPDNKIECATFYVHMVSTLGLGVELTLAGGKITVTGGIQVEVFDYYFSLMICADGSAHSESVFVRNTDLTDSNFYVGHDLTAGSVQRRHKSYIPGQHRLGADFYRDSVVGFYISDTGPCVFSKIHTILPRVTPNGKNLPWGPVE